MNYIKYPRTFHLPWSLGATSDDRMLQSIDHFESKEVVVTVKMDGENTTLYKNGMHARSINETTHISRDWLKSFHSNFANDIPEGYRICGENLYAEHSIAYSSLDSYFQVFSIWDEKNECLSWNNTVEWCSLLGLTHVPVLYRGLWDEKLIKGLFKPEFENDSMEGYVVRFVESFKYSDFSKSLAKFVRPNHVTSDKHWKTKEVIPNKLKN